MLSDFIEVHAQEIEDVQEDELLADEDQEGLKQ